ncbi:ABC transporter permease [Pseudothermotoga thermarum]|uniref:Monosaccharide ABC transporter membrane protein, CUT2 family n=1 Tax=Pseudothermotoga thermarum DSM 5069 TaxID=688269 RepID=F7YWG9_9THEM|nr:ABC transporter [Pseudothermotoga thermarum]AEH51948.1 monosaccharide ABC transporter membrane protein, CUT2 family [Pseudothermotoga thermarum DSM 5069]
MDKFFAILKKVDLPTLIIFLFLISLFVLAAFVNVSIPTLIGDSLRRIGMNGVLVLAMVPMIRAGVGPNFGLPVGIIGGLLGALISMQLGLAGAIGFWTAIALAVLICTGLGLVYGWLLEKVRGQEMMVGTYVGYSIVAFMSIMWLLLPFSRPDMIWAIGGRGLRYTLSLQDYFAGILNNFLKFKIGSLEIPTGLLLFFGAACYLIYIFFRTRIGLAIDLTGQNEKYAITSGVNVKKARLIAATLSTILGGIGIIVYAQSYGFLQLYQAPLGLTFPSVACILIGGASIRRATIKNVIIGTAVFQTLLTIALPVLSQVTRGDITEVMRMIISNGMILYALTRAPREAS